MVCNQWGDCIVYTRPSRSYAWALMNDEDGVNPTKVNHSYTDIKQNQNKKGHTSKLHSVAVVVRV